MPDVVTTGDSGLVATSQNAVHSSQATLKLCSLCASVITTTPENIPGFVSQSSGALLCATCKESQSSTSNNEQATLGEVEMTNADEDNSMDVVMTVSVSTEYDQDLPRGRDKTLGVKPQLSAISTEFFSAPKPGPRSTSRHLSSPEPSPAIYASSSYSASRTLSPGKATSTATNPYLFLDPFRDITRLRMPSRNYDCLYPGAVFTGIQTNNQKEHKVSVTIVDVCLANSTLSGFLTIQELTDNHPTIQTFFDGQMIGSKYGFLTENWGATDENDIVHWEQFPAFKHVKHELIKPRLTMKDRDRGVVFMRWKERFLVPDYKVKSISGASYAGFYYICIEFGSLAHNPGQEDVEMADATLGASSRTRKISHKPDSDRQSLLPGPHPHIPARFRRGSRHDAFTRPQLSFAQALEVSDDEMEHPPYHHPRKQTGPARLTGYYFHAEKEMCEKYQKLELQHIPESTRSHFEFR